MFCNKVLRHFQRSSCSLRLLSARLYSTTEQPVTKAPGWWQDSSLDCHGFYRVFINKIDQEGPQRAAALLKLIELCKTPEDAERLVKACRRLRGQRGRRGINSTLDPKVTTSLVKAATRAGNLDAAFDALSRAHELQLSPVPASFHHLMVEFAKAGEPLRMLEAFNAMKAAGLRPGRETAYVLVRGFVDCGVPQAAELTVREFRSNGVEPPPAALKLLQPAGEVASGRAGQQQQNASA